MSTLTRERIAQAAIEIADAEGMAAVSMRRVAARLQVGTMSLYHYVRTKDDLLGLMGDAIVGEFLIPPEELPDGWREQLREIALRSKASFDRHPWMLLGMLHGQDGPPGPNLMRHAEQTLATLAAFDLDPSDRFHLTGTVDEYVIGFVFRARAERAEQDNPAFRPMIREWFADMIASGEYPSFRAIFAGDAGGEPTADAAMALFERVDAEDRFERGLDLVLDGIAVSLERLAAG